MRRKVTNRNIVGKDHKYDSEKISKFINWEPKISLDQIIKDVASNIH